MSIVSDVFYCSSCASCAMFLSIPIDTFTSECILMKEKQPNLIMKNSSFVKLLYATETFTTNGLYIHMTIDHAHVKKYQDGNITKLHMDNPALLSRLEQIEREILSQYSSLFETDENQKRLLHREGIMVIRKTPTYKLQQHLERKSIKMPNSVPEGIYSNMSLLLKLSGVWISTTEYGITYKFIPVRSMV